MASLEQLYFYLAQGFKLFPCSNKDKRPLNPHGFKDATDTLDAITRWHQQYPDCAWGTPTSSAYGGVDIDPRNGGDATWASLIAEHGPLDPKTPCVETGSGGRHYLFRFPTGTRCGKLGEGIDLKADGGYVIVPPSRIWEPHHFQPYRWLVKPWEHPIPDAPDWVVGLSGSGKGVSKPLVADAHTLETHPGSPEGERRVTLCRLAGTALGCGLHPDLVWEQARAWASRCSPPFGEWERHVAGLVKRDREKPNNTLSPSPSPDPLPPLNELTNSPTPNRELVQQLVQQDTPTPNRELVSYFNTPTPDPITPTPERELVSSFTHQGEGDGDGGKGEVKGERCCLASPITLDPFTLSPEAYYGVLGELVQAISSHTEADDPALLVCLLTGFGNAIGFAPHFHHGKPHGGNLFVGLVGDTASRKGTATAIAKAVIALADPEWEQRVQHEGFGSGEGLIWSVRDPNTLDPVGITDKRLLVIEEEWAKTFTLSASDKSILTPIIRGCYDRIPIGKRNKGDNAYGCREPHVSIIGNITPDDLRQSLTGKNAVAIANGFLNRFLLVATRRTKFLPRGGRWKEYAEPFIPIIQEALAKAKTRSLMALAGEAESVWDALYADLETRPEGVLGAVTGRASDMVMKLAMVYALADGDDAIRVCHLRAGLAVWRYCEATAFTLFGSTPSPSPDPLWLELLNAITQKPGITRSELVRGFQRKGNADAIGDALEGLRVKGLAYPVAHQNPNGGPKGEKWFPVNGDREKPNNTLSPFPRSLSPSPTPLNELTNPLNPFAGMVVGDTPLNELTVELTPPTPDPMNPEGELVSYFNGVSPQGEGGLVMVKGEGVVRQWADAINANPQHPEPLPQWMYRVGDCPPTSPTGITSDWIRANVILKPFGKGFKATNNPSPEVVEWLQAHWEEGMALAKEYAELEAWFDRETPSG